MKVQGGTPAERAINAAKEFIKAHNVPSDFKIKVLLPAPNEASFMATADKWKALTGIEVHFVLLFRVNPPIAIIVPFMIWYSILDLIDTYLGMILYYTLATLPLSVWILKSF